MNTKEKQVFTLEFGGKTLTLETGQLAEQATASILARLGDTMVLATVVEGNQRDDIDYFPLTVEYVERLYAGGRIKGSRWVKREGRPTDEATLIGRLIDRSIRPLFPKEFKKEVQVIVTVLSVDGENEPDILSIIAVSAALAISRAPWNGPIGAIRMGYIVDPESKKGEFIANPTTTQLDLSELDLVVSQAKEKTLMIEAGAKQVSEDILVEAMKQAHTETQRVIEFIESIVAKIGQKKTPVTPNVLFEQAVKTIEKSYKAEVQALAAKRASKEGSGTETQDLIDLIFEQEKMADQANGTDKKLIAKAVEYVMFKAIRNDVVTKQKRVDGRKIDELRPLGMEVGILPRTHGSALFQRGMTQALTIATLGSPRMEQLIETAEGEESKRYIHHYFMPPYSVGEAGRVGSVSRREIGHGALAERALIPVIPSQADFPYTIRLVSEILSSNGSTSMASTCGSTLALMDAGVPILKPVAGISIGMMSNEDNYVLLTDILGLEDFSGDMDFKVAGTDTGVTAIQLDVKIPGLTIQQITETFERAKTARLFILEKMHTLIPQSRTEVSEFAPKIETMTIPVDKIGEVIGPGGKIIKNIIAQTGATVDVEDDGTVTVSGTSEEAVQKAYDWVKGIVREIVVGEEFEGPVKRILPFGAFVEFLPGKEGMVHVSKMGRGFVKSPEDVVAIGDVVKVRVQEIDDQGRINLAMIVEGGDAPQEGGQPEGDAPQEGGSEPRPYESQQGRPSYRPRPSGGSGRPYRAGGGSRGNDRYNRGGSGFRSSTSGGRDQGSRSDHPLSRQFQRERSGSKRGGYNR